jgi:PGF-pre-PGF domain-containing protein
MLEEKIMRNILRLMIAIVIFGSTIGVAFGATVTFDKKIDVPDREFTVKYPDDDNKTFTFTIDNLGNYKFGDNIGVTVNGGVNRMRIVIWSVDKISTLSESVENPGGSVSTTIPADRFDPSCPGVCDNNKMGPGIYALTVQDMVNGPPYNYITTKPFIISEYDLTVTPDKTQIEPGSSINVTVKISESGSLVDVSNSNNVKVELVQDSTRTHFGGYATKVSTGNYEANIQIPQTATGTHLLYAAITTNKNIYQDYPEIMGAGSYSEIILITNSGYTQTTTTPSSGGSGGGGGPSGEDYLNIEVKEKYELDILNDKITSYRFKNASNPINFINITGNISAGATVTSVEVLKDTSSLVKADAPGLVFKNMNIWVGTSGFAVPKNIKNAMIKFRVDNSWITKNAISNKDVKMFRWDGSQWIQLETTEEEKSDEYTFYEATTNSFSPFAIAAKSPDITPTAQITDTKPEITTYLTETTEPTGSGEAKNTPTGIGIILVFIIVIEVYLIKKKK